MGGTSGQREGRAQAPGVTPSGGGGSAPVWAPAAREGGAGAWAAVAGEGAVGAGGRAGLGEGAWEATGDPAEAGELGEGAAVGSGGTGTWVLPVGKMEIGNMCYIISKRKKLLR